jgi:hypothetical protein
MEGPGTVSTRRRGVLFLMILCGLGSAIGTARAADDIDEQISRINGGLCPSPLVRYDDPGTPNCDPDCKDMACVSENTRCWNNYMALLGKINKINAAVDACRNRPGKSSGIDTNVHSGAPANRGTTDLQRRLEEQKPKSKVADAVNKQQDERMTRLQQQYDEHVRQEEEARKDQEAEQAAEAAKEQQRRLDQERVQKDADRAARTVCFNNRHHCLVFCSFHQYANLDSSYCLSSCDAPNINSFHCFEAASAQQRFEFCRHRIGAGMQGCDR